MPNWCANQLTVASATPELRAYLKDHGFSFEKINPPVKPTPSSESMGGIQHQVDAWGTKWDLLEDDQWWVANELHETGIAYFDTAWSPPIAALEALSGRFPNDMFSLTYCELGNHFAGTATFAGGTSHDIPAEADLVMKIACEVFGYDDPAYEEPEEPAVP